MSVESSQAEPGVQTFRTPLSVQELQLVTFVEQHWNRYKKMPAADVVRENFPDIDYGFILQDPRFLAALSNRGIQPGNNQFLTQEQIAAVSAILDWSDRRSHAAKLRSLGITGAKWQGWLKNPTFKDYLHALSSQTLDDALHVAQEGLVNATAKGNTEAIKFYMELTGRYTGDTQQIQNFKVMIQRMVEAIQRHVKDQDTIRLIAQDFDIILNGGTPTTNPVLERSSI